MSWRTFLHTQIRPICQDTALKTVGGNLHVFLSVEETETIAEAEPEADKTQVEFFGEEKRQILHSLCFNRNFISTAS